MPEFRISIIIAAALTVSMLASCGEKNDVAENSDFLFDTYTHTRICGSNPDETLNKLSNIFQQLDASFSLCYDTPAVQLPDGEVYDECLGKISTLSGKYGEGINPACGELTALWGVSTDNPSVPTESEISDVLKRIPDDYSFTEATRLDFGAAAKGYACDKAYELLKKTDTEYAVVSLGSSTLLYGKKPDGKFNAGITNPHKENLFLGMIGTDAAFISTSGGYERFFEADGKKYSHILDMETGYPVETDLTSVTVVVPAETADGGIMSDFLSTLIYIQGTDELDKWLAYEEFEIVAADENGKVYTDCDGFILDKDSGYSYGK